MLRAPARRGLHAREGRRRAAAARGGDRPRQEVQAHDRGRRRPARDEGRPAHAALAVDRDRGRARRGARRDRPRRRRGADVLRAVRLPRARRLAARAPAADLLLQLAARRLPALHRASAPSRRSTPTCSSPTRRSRSPRARSCPWSVGNSGFYESVIQAIADRWEIDLDTPWQDLTREQQDLFLYGTKGERIYVQYRNRMGRRRSYMLNFEGIVPSLQRRYRETDSAQQRERIEEYMSFRPCPACEGARLKPEVLAVTVGGLNIHEFTRMSVTRCAPLPRRARADRGRAADRRADRQGDPRAAHLPRRRRRRLPEARPGERDALRRRGAAAAARDADRLAARRRPLHPRRAVDRAPPARQRQADRHARAAARRSATRSSSSSTTSR